MGDEHKTRRDYLSIKAIDIDGKEIDVLVSHSRLQSIAKRKSFGQIKDAGEAMPAVLQAPTAIFEGLTQETDDDLRGYGWRCYVGIPPASYTQEGKRQAPWEDEVFLVFINDDKVAYNWRWEKCDLDNPKLPEHWNTRFRTRIK